MNFEKINNIEYLRNKLNFIIINDKVIEKTYNRWPVRKFKYIDLFNRPSKKFLFEKEIEFSKIKNNFQNEISIYE